MVIVNHESKPLAAIVISANSHELRLLEETLRNLPDILAPKILAGDRAYEFDSHDQKTYETGIQLLALHKKTERNSEYKIPKNLRLFAKNDGVLSDFCLDQIRKMSS